MASKKGSVALTAFFTNLFGNFPKLMLTNLLFAVPTAVLFGLFSLINSITAIKSNFILLLALIPLFPFYAGVVQVTSHMVREEENINVFQNFISGVKDNFLRFLVHGAVLYAAIFLSYYSIVMYSSLGKSNGVFYMPLALCIVVSVFFLFAFYYIPPMTVTFDISMKNIYKNSALMTFGEFKHNLVATFGIAVFALVCLTVLLCCYVPVAVIIATIVLAALFIPSIVSFIINYSVYKPMYSMIVGKDDKSKEIDKKMENRRKGQFYDEEETKKSVADDFTDIKIDEDGDGDEYIYYNGKMVKRSVLLKLKSDAEKGGEE